MDRTGNCQALKDPKRQYQGTLNKAMGKYFETLIDEACAYYEKSGIAVIEKTPEPLRPIKNLNNGKFIACFEKKAQPDYKGALRSGRAVVFEAKFSASEKLPQSRVTTEQSERITEYAKMGAACFVLIGFDRIGYYRIPWRVWVKMGEIFGRRHIKPTDLSKFEVPCNNGVLHFLEDIEWRET